MESMPLLDCAGRLRSPATTDSFHKGPLGVGAPRPVDRTPERDAGRSAVLRRARPNPRAGACLGRDPRPTAPGRRGGRSAASVRAAPLCRPDGCAEASEKVGACWDDGGVDVGIARVGVVILS